MELESRIEHLERRCRRLTLTTLAMFTAAVASAFATMQATTQPLVRTENLEIMDSNGRVRARFGKIDSESYGLTIQTPDGRPRLTVIGGERGSAVHLLQGGQSVGTISLAAYQDSAGLTLRGSNSGLRAHMVIEGDRPRLGLWNADGNALFAAPTAKVASN